MIEILEADLGEPAHAEALLVLRKTYARHPSGGSQGLPPQVREVLPAELARRPWAHVLLAFAEREPAGLLTCLEGFSTFACRPLLNIHDLVVAEAFRRQGLASQLLQKAEQIALRLGCCKLTLEVLEGNLAARAVYTRFGFRPYQLHPDMGQAMFWGKPLPAVP